MEILFDVVKQKNDFNAQKEKHKRRQHTKQKKKSFGGSFVGYGDLRCSADFSGSFDVTWR